MIGYSVTSKIIEWLRFPCAAAVVLLHAFGLPITVNEGLSLYDIIRVFFSQGVCRVAVPIFFFISGYLFFVRLELWDTGVWIEKLKKRVNSLLVPYLLWNIIAFLLLLSIDIGKLLLLKNTPPHLSDVVTLYDSVGGIHLFWDSKAGYPLNDVLWFVRDLIILSIIAPVIYFFVKKAKYIGLLLIYTIYQMWLGGIIGLFFEGLFFFTFGAYFSINKMNFYFCFIKYGIIAAVICIPILIMMVLTYADNPIGYEICRKLLTLFGTVAIIGIIGKMIENSKLSIRPLLSKSSFFVYAAHGLVLPYVLVATRNVLPSTQIILIIFYFVGPLLVTLLLLFVYKIMRSSMPELSEVMLGGR